MSTFNENKISEIDSFVKTELSSVFDKPFNLISHSVTEHDTLKLHYTYGSDNLKVLFEVAYNTDKYKITKIHVYNPGNNKLSESYTAFCSELVDLDFLEYKGFQKIEAQFQMITPSYPETSIKVIGKTAIKSTYTNPDENISAIIRIID